MRLALFLFQTESAAEVDKYSKQASRQEEATLNNSRSSLIGPISGTAIRMNADEKELPCTATVGLSFIL